jgi:hypothetical protein
MEEILEKWESYGLLYGITDESLKIKLVNSFEIALNILLNESEDNKTNNIETIIFPALRRIICGVSNTSEMLNNNIELNEVFIHNYIRYIRDCMCTKNFNKHLIENIIDIDIEAELLCLCTSIYVKYINTIYNN